MMSELVERAATFAKHRHGSQLRKYVAVPYWHHLEAVAGIVADYGGSEAMVAAAWLHDTVEDAGVTFDEIEEEFGHEVREIVFWLTDRSCPEDGNRQARKDIDREHIRQAPAQAQTVKLADLIHNSDSIVEHDKDFARVYLKEKERLLDVMTKADPVLREHAYDVLLEAQMELVRANLKAREENENNR